MVPSFNRSLFCMIDKSLANGSKLRERFIDGIFIVHSRITVGCIASHQCRHVPAPFGQSPLRRPPQLAVKCGFRHSLQMRTDHFVKLKYHFAGLAGSDSGYGSLFFLCKAAVEIRSLTDCRTPIGRVMIAYLPWNFARWCGLSPHGHRRKFFYRMIEIQRTVFCEAQPSMIRSRLPIDNYFQIHYRHFPAIRQLIPGECHPTYHSQQSSCTIDDADDRELITSMRSETGTAITINVLDGQCGILECRKQMCARRRMIMKISKTTVGTAVQEAPNHPSCQSEPQVCE